MLNQKSWMYSNCASANVMPYSDKIWLAVLSRFSAFRASPVAKILPFGSMIYPSGNPWGTNSFINRSFFISSLMALCHSMGYFDFLKFSTVSFSLSSEILIISILSPNFLCIASNFGRFFTQGTHHVAQKSNNTYLPLKVFLSITLLSKVVRE